MKTYSFDDLTAYRRLHLVRGSASGGDSGTRLYRYLDVIRSKPAVVVPENSIRRDSRGETESAASSDAMFAIILHLLATFIADLFKPRRRLEVENLFLRHQRNVALRRAPQRVRYGAFLSSERKIGPYAESWSRIR